MGDREGSEERGQNGRTVKEVGEGCRGREGGRRGKGGEMNESLDDN